MKRKEFLKTSSALITGSLFLPIASCGPDTENTESIRKNWAGNYTYKAPKLHAPKSVEELKELVSKLDSQKALGTRHCFNNIADSPLNQISTQHLNKVVAIDREAMTVTVEGGIRYGDLAPQLEREQQFPLWRLRA